MNSKKLNKAENIAPTASLKVPFIQRARHHSETNDLPFNALISIATGYDLDAGENGPASMLIESRLNAEINKLGGSAPNESWFFNADRSHSPSRGETDKSPIIHSDYSDLSDDDEKSSVRSFKKSSSSFLKFNRSRKTSQSVCKSNYLQPPKKPSALSSSSTGNIDEQCEANSRRSKRPNRSAVKKRKRCYSMDERRRNSRNNDLDSPFSFDNLAYNNKENLSDISEPLSSSEKSNDDLNGKRVLKQDGRPVDGDQPKRTLQPPIIVINSQLNYDGVRFDLGGGGDDDEDNKNDEDKDYLIRNELSSSQLDVELGSKDSDEDLSDKTTSTALEFTTKLASDLSKAEIEAESLLSFVIQVLFPLLVCGLGNLVAGILLHKIESYEVFKEIPQLYIAIPCLMGLKGNLEMTMASRLSTAANLGILEHLPQILSMTKSNIALIQFQATVVSLLASLFGVFTMAKETETLNIAHVLILVSSNLITANIACVVLSALMIGIILFCKHKSINPDNVATPVASSLGDVSTVFLLGFFSSYLYEFLEAGHHWLSPLALTIILIVTPFSAIVAFRNKNTKKILKFGWAPIVASMVISSGAGVILDKCVKLFKGFALFQPIINGVGGNLAAIQASRISTYLHKTSKFGQLPVKELSTIDSKIMEANGRMAECKTSESNFSETSYIQLDERNSDLKDVDLGDEKDVGNLNGEVTNGPFSNSNGSAVSNLNYSTQSVGDPNGEHCFNQSAVKTRRMLRIRRKKIKNYLKVIFSSGSIHLKCARLLLLITLPMHVLYFYLIQLLVVEENEQIFGGFPFFVFFYLIAAFAQMVTLLYLAKQFVYWLWKRKIDPDDNSIPILTAIGDLIGTLLLAVIFFCFVHPAPE